MLTTRTRNIRDDMDLTPLHIAFRRGIQTVFWRLTCSCSAMAQTWTHGESTSTHLAPLRAKLDFTLLFLEHRANVKARGERNRSPLMLLRLLLEHKAGANVQGDKDQTPLHLASETGSLGPCLCCSSMKRTLMPVTPETGHRYTWLLNVHPPLEC